jgi:hypothetical protein
MNVHYSILSMLSCYKALILLFGHAVSCGMTGMTGRASLSLEAGTVVPVHAYSDSQA